jgi:hypothetical protein
MMKRCCSSLHTSERLISEDEFGDCKTNKDGKARICRTCTNSYHQNRRNNPKTAEKQRLRSHESYERNKDKHKDRRKKMLETDHGFKTRMVAAARCRAREREIEFELDSIEITIPEKCPVLGIPLIKNGGGWGQKDCSPSLDRIDPNKGYTKENTIVVSWRANKLKSNASLDELKKIYEYYRQFNNEQSAA